MANEATIRSALVVRSAALGQLIYSSQPGGFSGNVPIGSLPTAGPSPGAILVATEPGTDVSFAHLVTPGYAEIKNLSAANYVTVGIYDPVSHIFYPFMELLPGESYTLRFSRKVGQEYVGTGTAIIGDAPTVRIVANTAACYVAVNAFNA